jgi:hypothetical protein
METITNLTKKKALHILLIAGIMLLPIANFAQTKEQNEQNHKYKLLNKLSQKNKKSYCKKNVNYETTT